jgi:phosphohistidine phosphatase
VIRGIEIMKLMFFRHGIAEDKSSNDSGMDDFNRTLKKIGQKETKKVIKSIRDEIKQVDIIYSSPLLRALETAEIISTFYPKKLFEIMTSLDSALPESLAVEEIRFLPSDGYYCFVGHEPHLTRVISSLLNMEWPSLKLSKSGVVILEGETISSLMITNVLSPETLSKLR